MNNMINQEQTLKVYFDGLCPLCSREIEHYQKQKGAEKIQFVDICGPQFDADKENLDPKKIHQVMHVRKADGTVATAVDAFIEIWKVLPKYNWAAAAAAKANVRLLLNFGYHIFAKIRPWLPRKASADCSTSPYCELEPKEKK
jgi:predicted DCC family thiol-disulfide oxidoreductase YuxK